MAVYTSLKTPSQMLRRRKIGPAFPTGRVKAGPLLRLPPPGEDKGGKCATQEDLSKTLFGGYVYLIFSQSVRK
jgi:hypothetical protein